MPRGTIPACSQYILGQCFAMVEAVLVAGVSNTELVAEAPVAKELAVEEEPVE